MVACTCSVFTVLNPASDTLFGKEIDTNTSGMDTAAPMAMNTSAGAVSSSTLSACEKVINTVELLDAILAHVPIRQAFLLQKVSKAFYRHIHGSSEVAKAVHLSPKLNIELTSIVHVFPLLHLRVFDYAYLTPAHRNWEAVAIPSGGERQEKRELYFSVSRKRTTKRLGSWAKMLVVQPPLREMSMWIIPKRYEHREKLEKKTPHCDDGITVGLMVEAAKDLLSESVIESDLVYFGGIVDDDGKVVAQGMEKVPRGCEVARGYWRCYGLFIPLALRSTFFRNIDVDAGNGSCSATKGESDSRLSSLTHSSIDIRSAHNHPTICFP